MWAQSSPRLAFVLFLLYSYSSKWPRHESLTKIKILMKMLIYLKNHFKKIGSFRKSKGWITDIVPVSAEGNKTSKIFTFWKFVYIQNWMKPCQKRWQFQYVSAVCIYIYTTKKINNLEMIIWVMRFVYKISTGKKFRFNFTSSLRMSERIPTLSDEFKKLENTSRFRLKMKVSMIA